MSSGLNWWKFRAKTSESVSTITYLNTINGYPAFLQRKVPKRFWNALHHFYLIFILFSLRIVWVTISVHKFTIRFFSRWTWLITRKVLFWWLTILLKKHFQRFNVVIKSEILHRPQDIFAVHRLPFFISASLACLTGYKRYEFRNTLLEFR